MRLFVALDLPDEVTEHADRALAPARSRHPDLRWVPAARWHLTLAFYGEIVDDRVNGVADMVARRVGRHGPVELRLHGSGIFSRRALWLGVDGGVDDGVDGGGDGGVARLRSLAKDLTFDRSPFRAHLTVARLRGGVDASPAAGELAGYTGPAWVADTVHLVRSRLGTAPSYDDVATWPLTGRS